MVSLKGWQAVIYLPSSSFRFWLCPKLGVDRPSRYFFRIGWWDDDIRQASFLEYLEINSYQFERAMRELIPLEDRVYEALGYRDLSQAELEHVTAAYHQDMGVRANCTMRTALNRLMRQGKITRELHARGWFQWYVYKRLD